MPSTCGFLFARAGRRLVDFFFHDAVDSLTILPASIYDESGAEIGRATLRFDPRTELPKSLKSIRPRLFVKGA